MNKQLRYLIYQLSRLKNIQNIFQNDENYNSGIIYQPSQLIVDEWNNDIIPTIHESASKYESLIYFLAEETLNKIKNYVDKILELYDDLIIITNSIKKDNSNKDFNDIYTSFIETVNNLNFTPIFLKEDVTDYSQQDVVFIIEYIAQSMSLDTYFYLNTFNKLQASAKTEPLTKLIFAFNRSQDGTYTPELILDLNNSLYEKTKNNIINEELKLKSKEKESLIKIENAKNESTIIEFKNKAQGLRVYIILLNGLITSLFIGIILIFFKKYFHPPQDAIEIVYSITLVVAISSFIAFLMREKNILSTQYHNYMKCHTELVALATYLVDINEEKSEDLKIRLAEKYFTGYSTENNDNSINNEALSQIVSLLKDIQKKE